ncbi:Mating factor alpha precursor N-terminus [Kluyveromyces marxianus]|nr:Mating factor alpha precursor N-terminus [Kluyveromyces marxianus]
MRLSAVFVSAIALLSTVIAAPITEKESDDSSIKVPSEAILGFLDLTADDDVGLVKINNGTHSGILFLNTTIASIAYANETILSKREASAEADPWKEASPEAEAEADPWKWLSFRVGQPIYKREASPEAEADPWKWLSFRIGQPIY